MKGELKLTLNCYKRNIALWHHMTLHRDVKNSFCQLRHADVALPRMLSFAFVYICVWFEMRARALARTRVEVGTRRILFRGARYNARHARHNGANLFNLTNNKLISWLIHCDEFARHCSDRFPYAHCICVRCECRSIFPIDQWLTILYARGNIPSMGFALALTVCDVVNLRSECYHNDNEYESVSLSSDTFEVWILFF